MREASGLGDHRMPSARGPAVHQAGGTVGGGGALAPKARGPPCRSSKRRDAAGDGGRGRYWLFPGPAARNPPEYEIAQAWGLEAGKLWGLGRSL